MRRAGDGRPKSVTPLKASQGVLHTRIANAKQRPGQSGYSAWVCWWSLPRQGGVWRRCLEPWARAKNGCCCCCRWDGITLGVGSRWWLCLVLHTAGKRQGFPSPKKHGISPAPTFHGVVMMLKMRIVCQRCRKRKYQV